MERGWGSMGIRVSGVANRVKSVNDLTEDETLTPDVLEEELQNILTDKNVICGWIKHRDVSGNLVESTKNAKSFVSVNTAITAGTKTKITYDTKGLITSATDATTADITEAEDKNYVSDTQLIVLGNTSGINSGDETNTSIKSLLGVASSGVDGYLKGTDFTEFNSKQAADATLTALAGLDSLAGFVVESAPDTFTKRTISGTSNNILVSNGDGVDGNIVINIGSDVATLTGSQAFANKTINAINNTISHLNTTHFALNVIDTDLSSVSANDDTIPSAKSVKAYADTKEPTFTKGNLTTTTTALKIRGNTTNNVIGEGTTINIDTVSETQAGLLASEDFTTFTNKQNAITGAATTIITSNLTANKILISDNNGKVAIGEVSNTEAGYLSGVTSAIQTQLDDKQASIVGGALTITTSDLAVNKALISDSNGKVAVSSVTNTEVGFLSGVTSAVQTQLNNKSETILYGCIYEDSISPSTLTLTTNNIWYKWVTSTAGLSRGVTISGGSDSNMTILTTGVYRIGFNCSVAGNKNNNNIGSWLFVDETQLNQMGGKMTVQTDTVMSMSFESILNLTKNQVLDIRFNSSVNSTILSIYHCNFNIQRIG